MTATRRPVLCPMELDAALDFVRSRHQGVLITLKRDGRPQLSNIAYDVGDDGVVRISITDGRAKTANIRRDDRVSLHVTATTSTPTSCWRGRPSWLRSSRRPTTPPSTSWSSTTGRSPASTRDWDEYRRAMVDDQRLVVRLRPTRAYGMLPS